MISVKTDRVLICLVITLLINLAGLLYYTDFFVSNGYLPSPFMYDKSDTFMDLFNSNYWAYDDGRYTEWASIYPPMGFLFLQLMNYICGGSYIGDPKLMRDASYYVIWGLLLTYITIPMLVVKTKEWAIIPKSQVILIYLICIFSTPMLFALERGNMILFIPILLAVAISHIGLIRMLSIALLINIKPYFALLLIYYLCRKNWKGFIHASVISGLIFILTGFLLGGHFFIFFKNILGFSQEDALFSLREIMALPSSVSVFSYVLKSPDGFDAAVQYIPAKIIPVLITLIELLKWAVIVFVVATLTLKAYVMRDNEIIALIVVLITNMGIWAGGYSLIFYITLIPVFMRMDKGWLYLSILAVFAIPLDVVPLLKDSLGNSYSFLSDAYVDVDWSIGLGSLVRPVLNILLLYLFSYYFFTKVKPVPLSNQK